MEYCDAIPDLTDGKPVSVTPWTIGVIGNAGTCRARHTNLVQCVKDYNAQIEKGP
jgi:hypothetical protein